MMIAMAALFFDFFIILYLYKTLNRIFDPKFKAGLRNWTWASWSTRLARAGQYATWVGQNKVKSAFVKSAEGYDFKSQVTPEVYRLCRIHLYLMWTFVFLGFPAGIYLALT